MQGGYNVAPLIDALDSAELGPIAAKVWRRLRRRLAGVVEEKRRRPPRAPRARRGHAAGRGVKGATGASALQRRDLPAPRLIVVARAGGGMGRPCAGAQGHAARLRRLLRRGEQGQGREQVRQGGPGHS